MRWHLIALSLISFGSLVSLGEHPCRADSLLLGSERSTQLCRAAIAAAVRGRDIPPHLLAAIARVESGRKDPASGSFNPWPWAVNADGQGFFYESKAQAIAAVETMRQQGIRSIDVGCMQISLMHHPDAFASLEQAFDPTSNAAYGARFLTELHDRSNSWPRAVELYHSATPEIGQEYGREVYAALPAEQRLAEQEPPDRLAQAWAATTYRSPFSGAFRPSPSRVIQLPTSSTGVSVPGRSLDAYRSAPVRMAFRLMP